VVVTEKACRQRRLAGSVCIPSKKRAVTLRAVRRFDLHLLVRVLREDPQALRHPVSRDGLNDLYVALSGVFPPETAGHAGHDVPEWS
jgi:hypothetical protein